MNKVSAAQEKRSLIERLLVEIQERERDEFALKSGDGPETRDRHRKFVEEQKVLLDTVKVLLDELQALEGTR